MVQLLHLVYLPPLFPTARTRIHTLTFFCLFVWFFFFRAESNKFCILQSVTHWMDFLYSDYNAGSCRLNPLGESITHGQSNQEKIVSVILLSFSNPKVIAGWRFKRFMLDKTSYSETLPLPSRTRRNNCEELRFQRKWYYWHKMSCIVCPEIKI